MARLLNCWYTYSDYSLRQGEEEKDMHQTPAQYRYFKKRLDAQRQQAEQILRKAGHSKGTWEKSSAVTMSAHGQKYAGRIQLLGCKCHKAGVEINVFEGVEREPRVWGQDQPCKP